MQLVGTAYPYSELWQCACASLLALVLGVAPVRAENTNDNIDAASLTEAQKGEIWDQAIHILGGNANVISRWSGPVRFAMIDGNGGSTSHAAAVMSEIAGLTRLPLTMMSSGHSINSYLVALDGSRPYQLFPCEQLDACANFVVVVSDIESMRKIASAIPLRDVYQKALASDAETVCFFSPFQTASVIRQALVFVRDDLPADMINTCLQEEIYQSFGLFSDYTDSEYFSFNNQVQPKSITLYDRALLQATYEFPPGTPAFLAVKRLISNLEDKY